MSVNLDLAEMESSRIFYYQFKKLTATLEDWRTWEGRWELINGVAYDMTPTPSTIHQELVGGLYYQLRGALEEAQRGATGPNCRVFVSPVDVFLGENTVQPDLLVVSDPAKISERGIDGPPDLVVALLGGRLPVTLG